jgi:hypothetical protein
VACVWAGPSRSRVGWWAWGGVDAARAVLCADADTGALGGSGGSGGLLPSANCSGHGVWVGRVGCECFRDWFGATCDEPPDDADGATLWAVMGSGALVASACLAVYARRRWRRRAGAGAAARGTLVEPFATVHIEASLAGGDGAGRRPPTAPRPGGGGGGGFDALGEDVAPKVCRACVCVCVCVHACMRARWRDFLCVRACMRARAYV